MLKILLYRDPYDWVLARALFFMSDEFDGNMDFIKDGTLSVDDLLSLMIFGIHNKAQLVQYAIRKKVIRLAEAG